MTGGELAIVIEGRREDWPGGARTLTPRDPTLEPNGTFWFGAELDPDGGQVWFRIAEEAIGRMPEKDAPRPRRPLGRCPHRLDHAGPPARARPQPLRGPGLRSRRHVDRTSAVVKMDSLAPTPTARRLKRVSGRGCCRGRSERQEASRRLWEQGGTGRRRSTVGPHCQRSGLRRRRFFEYGVE